MATAVISLASSVIGGLLVLAGQWLTRRSDDRRYWRGLLRDAAADLATSFSQERAILTSDRRRGEPTSHADEDTYLVDRQRGTQPASHTPSWRRVPIASHQNGCHAPGAPIAG